MDGLAATLVYDASQNTVKHYYSGKGNVKQKKNKIQKRKGQV